MLGHINIYCTHWRDGHPLPNGLVEDELFGESDENLDPYGESNGRYNNQFLESVFENHSIPYKYTQSMSEPFIYFMDVCVCHLDTPRLNTSLRFIITKEIVDALNKHGILVFYDSEGVGIINTLLFGELKSLGLDLSKVVVLSAAKQSDNRLKSFFISHLGEIFYNTLIRNKSASVKLMNRVRKQEPHKTFSILTGRADAIHKALLVKRVYNAGFLDDSIFSLVVVRHAMYRKLIPQVLVDRLPIYADAKVDNENSIFNLVFTQLGAIPLTSEAYVNIIPSGTWRASRKQAPDGRLPNQFFVSVIAKRPFLMFSNFTNYLDIIRDLGYKTFDGILDESYDTEPNLQKRADLIIKQMHDLKSRDLKSLLAECDDILEHNLRLFMSKRTSQPFVDYLQSLSLYT